MGPSEILTRLVNDKIRSENSSRLVRIVHDSTTVAQMVPKTAHKRSVFCDAVLTA